MRTHRQLPVRLATLVFLLVASCLCANRVSFGAVEADILVAYGASYAASVGGKDNLEVVVQNAITGNNAINDRSGTGARMRVCAFYQSAQDDTGRTTTGGLVGWLANNDSRISDVVSYGATTGADLVTYLCQNTDASSIGGVAQQPGYYSAVNPAEVYQSTWAHEIGGHNYGRSHSDGILSPKTVMLNNYCGGGPASPYFFTNPNVWVSGTRLAGNGADTCPAAGATYVNGGDNSNPTADSALGVAQRRERVVYGPNLGSVVYDWRFNNAAGSAPAGTAVMSGAAAATVQGSGATFTGSALRLPGGASGSGAAYIQLPGSLFNGMTAVTVEIWATPLSATNYARIADFNNGTSNYLTLSSCVGTSLASQLFESVVGGTTVTMTSGLTTAAGVPHLYTIVYAPDSGGTSGTWSWYRDGDLITYLSVAYPLSGLSDVNSWLGRSPFSADAFANNDYAEVRVSSVAMSAGDVQANYRLGPNFTQAATATLSATDAAGASSFNAAGQWSNGAAPSGANSYETYDYVLRTPASASSYTFGGGSLTLSGGKLLYKSTGSSTITVNNFKLKGGTVYHNGSGTLSLNGSLAVADDGATMVADSGGITLNSALSGGGPVTYYGVNSTTLQGTNTAFTGKTLVGNGYVGGLAIDSKARLGANPSTATADQLQFNRGTLFTTATMALDDANRGVYFDVSGGTFNVASGTTLTLTSPLSNVNLGTGIVAGSLGKANSGTLILGSTVSSFTGTLYVDTGSTTANDGSVRVTSNQALASAHSPIYVNNTNTGTSVLQIDGTAGSITLPQRVYLNGRNGSAPALQNLAGTNTVAGVAIWAGGSNYVFQSDSGLLNFNGTISSGVSGTRTVTFQGSGDFASLTKLENGTADTLNVTKSGTGTLTLAGTATPSGTTAINAGTLKLNASFTSSGALNVAAAATLTGTGSTSATVTVNGTHAPGNVAGTQTFSGALSYGATAKLNWTLLGNATTASSFGQVSAQGVTVNSGATVNLVLNGTGSTVNFTNGFWQLPHTWTLLSATTLSGQFQLGSVSADSAGHAATGYGSFSLQQSGTAVTVAFYPVGTTPPTAPAGLSAAGSTGTVALTWTSVPAAASYNVYRSASAGGPYETAATGVTAATFTDTAVVNGTTYYYVVTAVNQNGESGKSTETAAWPHLPATIIKADNTTALNQSGSWTGGMLPSAGDTAGWTGLSGANSVLLGADTSLSGIVVGSTGGAVSIGAGNTLTLGAGGFDLSTATQNLSVAAGLKLGAGSQTWNVATGKTLALTGTFTRNTGTTLLVDKSANTGTVTAAPTLVNGLVPWAAVKSSGTAANNSASGYAFATKDTNGNLVAYTAATALTANYSYTSDATANYDLGCTGSFTYGSSRDANTARHTGGTTTLVTNSAQTWGFNGLMNSGTGTLSIGGGSFAFNVKAGVGTGTELVLTTANAGITLSGPIIDNTSASSVTVAGPNVVLLQGANTYSGGTNLASGELHVGIDSTPTSGTVTSGPVGTGTLTVNGGTLTARNANRTLANAVAIGGDCTLNGNIGGTSNPYLLTLTGAVNLGGSARTLSVVAPGGTTLSGIVSNGSLIKSGASTLILGGANTYGGGTTVNAGTLQLGNASALGAAGSTLIVNGGTLNLNAYSPSVGTLTGTGGVIANLTSGTSTLTINSTLSASFAGALQNGVSGQVLALTKQGSGTLTLSGTSTYSGATTISAGTLRLNGALTGGSAVAVGSGGTLAGSGTSSGPVTVAGGGALTPGNAAGAGTLTLSGALTLNNGSVLNLSLAAPGASTQVAVGGALNASGTTTVNVTALGGYGSGTYPLITGSTAVNASNFALGTVPGGYTYALGASGGTLSLTVAAPLSSPPGGLAATGGNSSVALGWTALTGAASYNVKRSTTSGSGYVTVASGVKTTSYTDTGLIGGTTYFYVVSGVNIAGESNNSNEASAVATTPIDTWRQQVFVENAYNPAIAGDTADPDGDGIANLVEYALGSDPTSTTAAPQMDVSTGKLRISFTRSTSATDVTMSVSAADSLAGPWTELARSTGGAAFSAVADGASVSEGGTGTVRAVQVGDLYSINDPAHPKRFLRLQVTH